MSGVPPLGLPKINSVEGASSSPALAAPAAWSIFANKLSGRFSIAAARRATVSEKLCGLVTVLMGGLALVIEVSFLVVAEGVEVEDVVGTEPVTSGTLAGEQAIAMRAVQVRIIL